MWPRCAGRLVGLGNSTGFALVQKQFYKNVCLAQQVVPRCKNNLLSPRYKSDVCLEIVGAGLLWVRAGCGIAPKLHSCSYCLATHVLKDYNTTVLLDTGSLLQQYITTDYSTVVLQSSCSSGYLAWVLSGINPWHGLLGCNLCLANSDGDM